MLSSVDHYMHPLRNAKPGIAAQHKPRYPVLK